MPILISIFIIFNENLKSELNIQKIRAQIAKQIKTQADDRKQIEEMIKYIVKRKTNYLNLFNFSHHQISIFFDQFQVCKYSKQFILYQEIKSFKISSNKNQIFIGNIVNEYRDGKGILLNRKGQIYEGQFLKNKKHGIGVEIYSNNNFYIGAFNNNKQEGLGKMIWLVQNQPTKKYQYYKGQWLGGTPFGKGYFIDEVGSQYFGSFQNGLKSGQGIELSTKNKFYKGQYQKGYYHGSGLLYENDELFEGNFYKGLKSGFGKWISFSKNEKYEGYFQSNEKNGQGVYHFISGNKYQGVFKNNKIVGKGQYFINKQKMRKEQMDTELQNSSDEECKIKQQKSIMLESLFYNNYIRKIQQIENRQKKLKDQLFNLKNSRRKIIDVRKPFIKKAKKFQMRIEQQFQNLRDYEKKIRKMFIQKQISVLQFQEYEEQSKV